ncbi:PorY family sensor histidine kinase [Sphingobacterium rhinopitheci]|uniref:PorY family sensor histidine kinase n=1 Tax=Sphingobacterium rhinopitheci TaxID=2781960 RepID=UPI001F524966|nr:HAMP domain-containing sensor histidine kinase [Sphingobacterium rhinopitheci]MCI0920112.1 HAMP domain-containing histidine kinase [Sphingobacterium rhinopitheci]
MSISVKNYTSRYIAVVILIVMAIWALLFYAFMMDEVYDNIDDGLKNQKIEIIRAVYSDSTLLETKDFGINQFRITPSVEKNVPVKDVFSREFIFMPYDGEDEPYRVLRTSFNTADGTPYSLEIRTSTVEEDDYLINLAISLTVLYIVIVLSILMVNYYVLSKAWKPFTRILHNLNEYRFGEVTSFIPVVTNVKEFEVLNANIESMIARNEKAFDNQKVFLENASHELQTPLAITINKLELVLSDESLSEEQMIKIADAKKSLLRMVNLNKSLLLLSRIDNDQYNSVGQVNGNTLLLDIINELKEIIEFKGLSIDVNIQGEFTVNMNTNLASILFSNLIRNAIKYNMDEGKIMVDISVNEIRISNTSNSGALNPDYIFERFYKGKQDNQSNGLGLSIVSSILNKYPFLTLQYLYVDDLHTFSIKK